MPQRIDSRRAVRDLVVGERVAGDARVERPLALGLEQPVEPIEGVQILKIAIGVNPADVVMDLVPGVSIDVPQLVRFNEQAIAVGG
ncbi:MAG TPA: hypothetical protein VFJ58_19550 [Armatimonadota bacterium]|nr:hypothetical protein [Armatimonadota bacterium]